MNCSASGLSPTNALDMLRDEIRYRLELCPCTTVNDDFVELNVTSSLYPCLYVLLAVAMTISVSALRLLRVSQAQATLHLALAMRQSTTRLTADSGRRHHRFRSHLQNTV